MGSTGSNETEDQRLIKSIRELRRISEDVERQFIEASKPPRLKHRDELLNQIVDCMVRIESCRAHMYCYEVVFLEGEDERMRTSPSYALSTIVNDLFWSAGADADWRDADTLKLVAL